MDVTIRQILSVVDSDQLVTIFNGDKDEFFGTVEDCQTQLPNAVLDSFALNLHVYANYGEGILEVYRRVVK